MRILILTTGSCLPRPRAHAASGALAAEERILLLDTGSGLKYLDLL